MISLFDMFKVGIGPSSSHTVGPMKAGKQFVDDLVEKGLLNAVTRVAVDVYGSLSLTGKGHHTDIAIIMDWRAISPIRSILTRSRLLSVTSKRAVVCCWPTASTRSTSRRMTACVFAATTCRCTKTA